MSTIGVHTTTTRTRYRLLVWYESAGTRYAARGRPGTERRANGALLSRAGSYSPELRPERPGILIRILIRGIACKAKVSSLIQDPNAGCRYSNVGAQLTPTRELVVEATGTVV